MQLITKLIFINIVVGPIALAVGPSRTLLDRVISLVEMKQAIYLKEILDSPGINEDLGRAEFGPLNGGFKYNMAYQASYIIGDAEEMHESFASLIKDYQRFIIPLCHDSSCILCRFNYDAKSNKVELSSYGANLEAARIAMGHKRLRELKPNYEGAIDIVGYPDNNYEFLLLDAQSEGDKILFPVSEQQAQNIYDQLKGSDHITPEMRSNEQVNELSPAMMAEVMRRTKEAAQEIPQDTESFESTSNGEGSLVEDEESQITQSPKLSNIEVTTEITNEISSNEKYAPEVKAAQNLTDENQSARWPLLLLIFGLAALLGIWLVRRK